MFAKGFCLFNSSGRLLCKNAYDPALFKEDCFIHPQVVESSDPFDSHGSWLRCQIKRTPLILQTLSMNDDFAAMKIEWMDLFVQIINCYYKKGDYYANFNPIYVLRIADAMLGFGLFPLTSEKMEVLDRIPPPSFFSYLNKLMSGSISGGGFIQSPIPWRKNGIKHASNEIYFDLKTFIDAQVYKSGKSISKSYFGELICKSQLSGMPEVLIKLLNPQNIGDCAFHPCVRYQRFQKNKELSFIPPDGVFRLMKFSVKSDNDDGNFLPVSVLPKFPLVGTSDITKQNLEVYLTNNMGKELDSIGFRLFFPPPINHVTGKTSQGYCKYDRNKKELLYYSEKIAPGARIKVVINVQTSELLNTAISELEWEKMTVNFSASSIAFGNISINSAEVSRESYSAKKGMRTFALSGSFEVRVY